jgi:hypothetical protein
MQAEIEVFFQRWLDLTSVLWLFPRTPIGKKCAPVAQLDRAPDYESGGQGFESLRVYHFFKGSFFEAPLS